MDGYPRRWWVQILHFQLGTFLKGVDGALQEQWNLVRIGWELAQCPSGAFQASFLKEKSSQVANYTSLSKSVLMTLKIE
jgi:hypothetical protein